MEDLLYLYGLIPSAEAARGSFPASKDFDGTGEIYTIPIGEITAIVCNLASEQYAEERIKDLIQNDMEWLQEKAFHHHDATMNLSKCFTMVPLKFCTIFKNKASLETAVRTNESKLLKTFSLISGKEEWNVKIYCEDELIKKQLAQSSPLMEQKRAEISQLSKGRQFFEKKKLDKVLVTQVDEEKNKLSHKIHTELAEFALQATVKRTWGQQVTGRNDKMAWNGVYLISQPMVDPFLEQIRQYERDMGEKGWQFVASGPWPAYHFSSF